MTSFEAFRANTLANFITSAVKIVEKIEKKIRYLEFENLFRVKGDFITLFEKNTAFDEALKLQLSPNANKWLKKEHEIINWKIGALTLKKINQLYSTDLKLEENWDLATTGDKEKIFLSFQLDINTEDTNWDNLDEVTQREIKIIFDAVDNSKYFLHSIDSYFIDSEDNLVDVEYKNHLIARL